MNRPHTAAKKNDPSGFTLVEIVVTVAVIGIAAAIVGTASLAWRPNYSLNSAAKDLNSILQIARMNAVTRSTPVYVVFDNTSTPGRYLVTTDKPNETSWASSTKLDQADLASYGYNIDFAIPSGGFVNWNGDSVSNAVTGSFSTSTDGYPYCTFNPDGTSNGLNGTLYLTHRGNEHLVYAVTLLTTGFSKIRKYNGIKPYHEDNWLE